MSGATQMRAASDAVTQRDSVNDLIGRTGKVTLATRGTAGPGKVCIDDTRYVVIAWSIEPLAKGEPVLIINQRGVMTFDVELVNNLWAASPVG